jgi:type VI secretion system protein ImpF
MTPAPRLHLPLLDRLMDADAELARDAALSPAATVHLMRQAVRRDVEALLNARRRRQPLPAGLTELAFSPLGYGVPDPTAGSFTTEEAREALAREIEITLRRFEPRLDAISVSVDETRQDAMDRTLRLQVEAILRTDPAPEQIVFETLFRPATLDVTVRER